MDNVRFVNWYLESPQWPTRGTIILLFHGLRGCSQDGDMGLSDHSHGLLNTKLPLGPQLSGRWGQKSKQQSQVKELVPGGLPKGCQFTECPQQSVCKLLRADTLPPTHRGCCTQRGQIQCHLHLVEIISKMVHLRSLQWFVLLLIIFFYLKNWDSIKKCTSFYVTITPTKIHNISIAPESTVVLPSR